MHYLKYSENGTYENENCINIYSFPKNQLHVSEMQSYMNRKISR